MEQIAFNFDAPVHQRPRKPDGATTTLDCHWGRPPRPGWGERCPDCIIETVDIEELEAMAEACLLARRSDRYLKHRYGITFYEYDCGQCKHFAPRPDGYGDCALDPSDIRHPWSLPCRDYTVPSRPVEQLSSFNSREG